MTDTLLRLEPIFRDVLDDPKLKLSLDSNPSNVAGWDSLAQINVLTIIEQEFGLQFALADFEQLSNIGDLVQLIDKRR